MSMQAKQVLDRDVLSETRERMDFIFEHYDHLFLAFSGGKDSGLTLNLLLDAWERNGAHEDKIRLIHTDDEYKHEETDEFIFELLEEWPDAIHIYWSCLPVVYANQTNEDTNKWYPWNPEESHRWNRDLPDLSSYDNAELVRPDHRYMNEPFTFEFGKWRHYHVSNGIISGHWHEQYGPTDRDPYTEPEVLLEMDDEPAYLSMTGMRTAESLQRWTTIMKLAADNEKSWLRVPGNRSDDSYPWHSAHPVYDWDDEDLWAAHHELDWPYNETYDKMHRLGYAPMSMRTSHCYGGAQIGAGSMDRMKNGWPEQLGYAERRLDGAMLAFEFGFDMFNPTKPEDLTWREYAAQILNSMDEDRQEHCREVVQNKLDRHGRRTTVPLKETEPCPICGESWKEITIYLNDQKNTILQGQL